MSALLNDLNAEQLAAVTLPRANALILAGAGSGKTRVLTTRIAWLIQTGQVSPAGVLAVTFTNKAAKEMLARLSAMLPINVRGMWVGTFHGLCNRFLRAHWREAGLPQSFQILDAQDQLSAAKRLLKQANVDEARYPAKQFVWFVNGCKEEGKRAAAVQPSDDLTRKFAELYGLYEQQCQREGVVDFAELLLRTYELLRDLPALRAHYRRRFRHVLVDEFQDTNDLQYAWLKMLAGLPGEDDAACVFAVGDDDQSIYAFRGANVGNMAAFERQFQVHNLVKLEQNYRSHGHILDSANHLIGFNARRLGKNLRTDRGAGEPVRVYESASDGQEAQWLVEEARQLQREGMPLAEIAVLYRSNAQSRALEQALFNAGMPYRVYGGLRFFERAEIKHALAYLRLIESEHDDTSFLRVANFPARGIGARTLEQLQDLARARGCSLAAAVDGVGGRGGEALRGFIGLLQQLRQRTLGLTLAECVEDVIEASGLVAHYAGEREGKERVENLRELVNAAASFATQEGFGADARARAQTAEASAAPAADAVGGDAADDAANDAELRREAAPSWVDEETGETVSPLSAFLAHAALESGDNQAQAGADALQLMTIHSAKGLEFDVVFVTGLEEGLFPHENALLEQDGVEEERRLMYVAITRARRRLYLSCCQTRMLHGQTRYNIRSRFLDELPEASLKWITPPGRPAGGAFGADSSFGFARSPLASWQVPAAAAAGEHAGLRLRPGQSVFHNKFGEGVVVSLDGGGADARAQVNFGRHGLKWLALAVAKLTPI
jgi:DNA helicase-2/ATP-dependent DNA helicase PcrA